MTEIAAFAAAQQPPVSPSTVVQNAKCGNGGAWARWQSGGACTLPTAEKLRAYMAAEKQKAVAERNAA